MLFMTLGAYISMGFLPDGLACLMGGLEWFMLKAVDFSCLSCLALRFVLRYSLVPDDRTTREGIPLS